MKRYGIAYLDLYAASDRASRRVVEDLRADGLRPVQRKGEPVDIYTRRGGESLSFDGEWKRQQLSGQLRERTGVSSRLPHRMPPSSERTGARRNERQAGTWAWG